VLPVVFTPATVRGRVYLFHGINDMPANFAVTPPWDSFISGAEADGWQVMVVGELYDGQSFDAQSTGSQTDFTTDPGGGSRYRSETRALYDQTKAWIDYKYGPPVGAEVLVGVSWGGLAVELIAQSDRPIRAFVAHEPATKPAHLSYFAGDVLPNLQPTPKLGGEPGWSSYGLLDTSVGHRATQALATTLQGLDPLVQIVAYDQTHETLPSNVTDILAFLAAVP
jgi:dienelactone hydrolase